MIYRMRHNLGLGNRVAALANGLSRPDGERVEFGWPVNAHCPLPWHTVFPQGIDGVDFFEPEGTALSSRIRGVPSEAWEAAEDRAVADAAYTRIIGAMAGQLLPSTPPLAICGRFFRNPHAMAAVLAAAAVQRAECRGISRVFLFCDCYRAEITDLLESAGLCAVLPAAPELRGDLDRHAADLLAYLGDWKTLLAAEEIIACDGPASALLPARAAGKIIITAA